MKRKVKKISRLRQRQRQKMSRKQIIVITTSCVACMCIGLTVFMNLSSVDKSKASGVTGAVSVYMVEEPVYIDEKTLSAPIVKPMPVTDEHTMFVRKTKVVRNDLPASSN